MAPELQPRGYGWSQARGDEAVATQEEPLTVERRQAAMGRELRTGPAAAGRDEARDGIGRVRNREAGIRVGIAVALLVGASLAACAGAPGTASPGGSTPPTGGPSQSPTIDHPSGAADVVLRLEQGGGFVPPGFLLTEAPIFTLYGTGSVIFRDPASQPAPPAAGAWQLPPFTTAILAESEVQALLRFALGPGKLAVAGAHYDPGTVADAGTTTFTIRASGMTKAVSVVALGIAAPTGGDGVIVAALASLRDRLLAAGRDLPAATDWVPERYRAVLLDAGVGDAAPSVTWPWPEIAPSDFRPPSDAARPRFPTHVLTAAQAASIGIPAFEGGLQGLRVVAPSGTVYGLVLRPLLPDETE